MIELGVKQKLYIDHKTDFGVYLSDTPERNGKSDCVLLPKKQVPQNAKRYLCIVIQKTDKLRQQICQSFSWESLPF